MTPRQRLVAASVVLLLSAAWIADVAAMSTRDAIGRRTVFLGRSVSGRAITAVETGDLDNPSKTLVVGCIHGNECAGIAVAERLAGTPPPPETDLWVVTDLNPDGAVAG